MSEPTPPSLPPLPDQLKHLAADAAEFVKDGFETVTHEEHKRRWAVCQTCENLLGNRCTACGCFVWLKAWGRVWKCELGKWDHNHNHKEPSNGTT